MSFTDFMNVIVELFGILYTTGMLLISFLATPLSESLGSDGEFLGELLAYTPFELMFGAGLLVVLMTAIIKFFVSIF